MKAKVFGVMAVGILVAGVAVAVEVLPDKPVEPEWGTSSQVEVNYHSFHFVPIRSDTTYDFQNWMKYLTGGYPSVATGVHLPAGVQIQRMSILGCDDDPANTFQLTLWACPNSFSADPCTQMRSITSAALTGCGYVNDYSVGVTIDNYGQTYFLEWFSGVLTNANRFRHAELYYVLQISPAPATARFTDVPTSHPLFQYVEALASSGITAGCTATTYCPDSPLTRGQMAVYLSKALGLHFPY